MHSSIQHLPIPVLVATNTAAAEGEPSTGELRWGPKRPSCGGFLTKEVEACSWGELFHAHE